MWHMLAQYLSHLTKAFGLLPFRIRLRAPIKVEMCPISLFYCCVHASVVTAISIFAILVAIDASADDKLTLAIIFRMSIVFSYCRTIDFYLFQIRNRHLYAATIEDITNLYHRLMRLNQTRRLFDIKFARICGIRLLGWSIQIVLMLSNIFVYEHMFSKEGYDYRRRLISVSLEVYTNVVKTFFTNIYFGCMLLMLQFFCVINENVEEIMKSVGYVDRVKDGRYKMSMQAYCDFSDRLDQISDMFDRVTRCMKMMIALFSVQLLMMFLDTFSIILFQVCMFVYLVYFVDLIVSKVIIFIQLFELYAFNFRNLRNFTSETLFALSVYQQASCLLFYCFEIYAVVWVSANVVEEVSFICIKALNYQLKNVIAGKTNSQSFA